LIPGSTWRARCVMRIKKTLFGEEFEGTDEGLDRVRDDQALLSPREISLFIDEIEDLIYCGVSLPFTSKAVIDQKGCLETLEMRRDHWPWEMWEARRILSEEGEVLGRAEAAAQEMRQRAERQAAFILAQSQLIKVAEARAQEMMESAEKEAAQVLHRAERDARDVYLGLERELDLLLRDIKELVAARLSKLRR